MGLFRERLDMEKKSDLMTDLWNTQTLRSNDNLAVKIVKPRR